MGTFFNPRKDKRIERGVMDSLFHIYIMPKMLWTFNNQWLCNHEATGNLYFLYFFHAVSVSGPPEDA